MRKKAILTLLLVMLLAVSSLAACGQKQSAEPAPADTTTTQDTTAAQDTTAEPQQTAPAENGEITEEKAKEIALADAGVDAASAVFKRTDLDTDDGVRVYEVEFFANDTEYSYDIDVATGDIRSKESDAMDAEDYQEMEALKQ